MGHNRKVRALGPRHLQPTGKTRHSRLPLTSGVKNLTWQTREVGTVWQSRGDSAQRSGASVGIGFGCSDNWASVTHLEHGLSRRPTQSMGFLLEAKEAASGRGLGKS